VTEKKWREFEQLVAQIQQGLAPDARVEHDVRLAGERTGEPRQVDVLLTQTIGQYTMRVAIDCKDYKTPVDVKGVEEFYGLVDDIGVNKGVLVSASGFTTTAKKRAKGLRIDLYRPVDTGDHKWKVKVGLPALCEFVSARIGIQIATSSPMPFRISEHPGNMRVVGPSGNELPSAYQRAIYLWNSGELPTDEGQHEGIELYEAGMVQVDNGYGSLIEVSLTAHLFVASVLYFGQVDIKQLSGFIDENTGLVHANAFTTGEIDPDVIESSWMRLSDGEPPPQHPILTIRGLVGWEM
jgi:hypothetical protein